MIKKVEVDGITHLCLFATADIPENTELRYDYGVPNLPWRTTGKSIFTVHVFHNRLWFNRVDLSNIKYRVFELSF